MSIRFTQKPQISTKLETGKYHKENTRERSFITSCLKEIKEIGYTICFEQWQVDEVCKRANVIVRKREGCFILSRKEE